MCHNIGGSFDSLLMQALHLRVCHTREQHAIAIDTNVASVAVMIDTFIPLLEQSKHTLDRHIINARSTIGSLSLVAPNNAKSGSILQLSISCLWNMQRGSRARSESTPFVRGISHQL